MSTACSLRWSASLINGECMTWSSMTSDALDTSGRCPIMSGRAQHRVHRCGLHVRSLSYHVRSCTTRLRDPSFENHDSARTGHAHLNNQVQPQRRGRVMLVPTKIDLTVDAERHKTFKVPPFLQALEHSSDCERFSQRVEKKIFNFFNKKYGQGSNPLPPPKRACPFLGK